MKRTLLSLLAILIGGLSLYFYLNPNKGKQSFIDEYGKSFNSTRQNKHLPIIEDSWIVRIRDSSHIRWSHKSIYNKKNTPEHIWKTLYFEDSDLIAEEDAFNYDQGDSIGDRLIVVMNFKKPDSIRFKFSRHYYKSYPPSQSIDVDFKFADSIFNEWGFRNLYKTESN